MFSKKMEKALNDQVVAELYSGYLDLQYRRGVTA